MLGMASNAKEKQRKGEQKRSRGSREKGRGKEEERKREGKRQLARLVGSLGNNSMAKSIDAARRWPRAPRLATPRPHTHSVLPKSWWLAPSLDWFSCIGCFSGAASVISSIIIVGSIKTKSQIKLLLQHATCNKNGDNVSIVVAVFMLCLCPPARLTTSAASATPPTPSPPSPPGQVESY